VSTGPGALVDRQSLFHDDLMSCGVVVEQVHKHHQQGQQFAVRIDVTLPGTNSSSTEWKTKTCTWPCGSHSTA